MERFYIEAIDGKTIVIFARHIIAMMPAGDGTDIVTAVGTYYSRHNFEFNDNKLTTIINASMARGLA